MSAGLLALAAALALAFAPAKADLGTAQASTQGAAAPSALTAAGTFNPSLLLPGSKDTAEPSIRTDQWGRSYVIAPIGLPAGCRAFRVSHDGSTWKYLGAPDATIGGGDCDWALGPKQTAPAVPGTGNTIAFSSLTLANLTVGKSTDGGATWSPPNVASTQVAGDDREWMDADPKPNALGFANIYMTYHDLDTGDIQLSVSTDGGFGYVQSGPIINNQDVPVGQWAWSCPAASCIAAPTGFGAGNSIGNLIAFRPKGGQLKLYSIFETAEDVNDNFLGTGGQSRVYEAIGTVTDNPAGGPPVISWRNYEVWHGPVGARYDKIFPVIAVDAAGGVYAVWSDGAKNYVKYSRDGVDWGCPAVSTVPTGAMPCTAPGVIPNPAGVNATVFPWIAAGKDGIADVVFYGTNAPTAGDYGDPADVWQVYFAQTTDRAQTWSISTASDHAIHTGGICVGGTGCAQGRVLLDFFQVAIDPTNGAATIAYSDDHESPGTSIVYYTRQCTGVSATTGLALVDDCKAPVAPPPPPQSTSCPGPQILDYTGDAPNIFPGGDGATMDNFDVVNTQFATPDASSLRVTMKIKNLQFSLPPANATSVMLTTYWDYNGTTYFAQGIGDGVGPAGQGRWSFTSGTFNNGTGRWTTVGTTTGTATLGPNGTVTVNVPRANVGNPANGAALTNVFADTHGALGPQRQGAWWTAAADRAPDAQYGSTYTIGAC